MTAFADVLAAFTPPERTLSLVTNGALRAEHARMAADLKARTEVASSSLAGDPSLVGLAREIRSVEARIKESALTFTIRGIGHNAFRRLLEAHEDESGARRFGPGFPAALIAACVSDPDLTEDQVEQLGGVLTDGQWDELFDAAWTACREVDGIPFNALASAMTRDSGEQ